MAGDARTLLLKFKSDLNTLKENAQNIKGIITDIGSSLTKERDKSKADAKKAHDDSISLAKQQLQVQMNIVKAKQAAAAATTKYEEANAASQLKRLNSQLTEIKNQQTLLNLKKQLSNIDSGSKGDSGLSSLLKSFAGSASGGGLLGSLVAGAAGGGVFAIFSQLASALGSVAKEFANIPFKAGELSESLEKAAARAGVTTQQFQQLKLASAAAGMDSQTMSRALSMMNLQFTRTTQGLSKTEKELSRFGVSIRDSAGNLLPTTEIIKRVGDLFQQLPDRMTKSRLAADIFTRRIGSQMIPLLNQGGEAIQNLYDRADKYSILLNEDVITAQHQLNVETIALKMQWEKMEVSLGQGLLPMLVKMLGVVNDLVSGFNQLTGVNLDSDIAKQISASFEARGLGKGKFSTEGKSQFDQPIPTDVTFHDKGVESRAGQKGTAYRQQITWKQLFKSVQAAELPTNDIIDTFAQRFPNALEQTTEASRKLDSRLQDNTKSLKSLAMASIKYKEALAQLAEKQSDSSVEGRQLNLKNRYDQWLISQQDFTEQSKQLDKESYDSKVKYINEWSKLERQKIMESADAQKKSLTGDTEIDASEMAEKKENLEKQTQEQILTLGVQTQEKLLDAKNKFEKEKNALDLEDLQSIQKANQLTIADDLKTQQARLSNDKSFTDYMLKQRLISVDDYLTQRKSQIDQEVKLSLEAAQEEYDNAKKTPEAQAQLMQKQIDARMKGEKELTDLLRSEVQTRASFSESRYQGIMGYFQGQQTIAKSLSGGSGVTQSNNALQQQILATQRYKEEQTELLHQTQPMTDEWFKILGNMTKATQELIKMNEELLKSRSVLGNLGNIFQQMSGLFAQLGQSRGNLGKIGEAGGVLDIIAGGQTKRSASGKGGGVFSDMIDAFKDFNFKDMSTSMQKFNEGIKGAVGAVGGFVQILGSSQGHAGDIAGGAISGMGLGGDIGSMFSQFSSMAGPIGQVAGIAFGGILSGIIGQKNNQVQQFINSINKQMQNLQTAIQDGSTGIQQGINDLESMKASVLSQAGSSKKKQKAALEQEAQAIQNEITALQQQQQAMFVDLGNQLKVLNAPIQYQGLLGGLKDIMDQYKRFAGAARDANDLAQANQFLADSLKNFADTQQTDLNQAEQQAIQDALKLNDLLVQRQQLLTSEAQTEYDIMTQGVLVNQRTVAMTKMQQIQLARNQENVQLEQMNQDIALTTYKVQAESQIFDLATTRIGLEAQLLTLQEAQTDKDMLRIEALKEVVAMLQSGTPLTNIDQIIAALGLDPTTILPGYVPIIGTGGGGAGGAGMGHQIVSAPGTGIDLESAFNALRSTRAASGFSTQGGYINS